MYMSCLVSYSSEDLNVSLAVDALGETKFSSFSSDTRTSRPLALRKSCWNSSACWIVFASEDENDTEGIIRLLSASKWYRMRCSGSFLSKKRAKSLTGIVLFVIVVYVELELRLLLESLRKSVPVVCCDENMLLVSRDEEYEVGVDGVDSDVCVCEISEFEGRKMDGTIIDDVDGDLIKVRLDAEEEAAAATDAVDDVLVWF